MKTKEQIIHDVEVAKEAIRESMKAGYITISTSWFLFGLLEECANQQLQLGGVVGQSEQLLALSQYMFEHQNNLDGKTAKDYLQNFLSQ